MPNVKRTTLILTAFLFMHAQQSNAAEFCATSSAGLEFILAIAEDNGESDVIRIAKGSYDVPVGGFNFHSNENFDIEISGGWSEFFGNACGQQVSPNAFDTVLDGNGTERIMDIRVGMSSDINVSHLMFIAGNATIAPNDVGGGLNVHTYQGYQGNVTIEYNAFISNTAVHSSALRIREAHRIIVRNNLFTLNHSENSTTVNIYTINRYGVYFTNNTLYGNTSDGMGIAKVAGLYLTTSGTSSALVANNLFWDNDYYDIIFYGDGYKYLKNNNYQSRTGIANETSMNIQVPPEFESGWFNYTPAYYSPLVNAGTTPPPFVPIPPPFVSDWEVGTHDIYGNPRIQNTQIDIGAVESPHGDLIFIDGFE